MEIVKVADLSRLLLYYKRISGISYKEVAEKSGVPESTVKKIFTGTTKNPRSRTVDDIMRVLNIREVLEESAAELGYMRAVYQPYQHGSEAYTQDTITYERANHGPYTVEDYHALPDDQRVELIDGEFFTMDSPSVTHQTVVSELVFQFNLFIKNNKGRCRVYPAPIDVQLDRDDKTMLVPDVVVLCDPDKNTEQCIYGAPDFICEVLSPSTRSRDLMLKLWKYMNSGVREYWVVDTGKREVLCYFFEEGDEAVKYSFDSMIPVRIYSGELEIDLNGV